MILTWFIAVLVLLVVVGYRWPKLGLLGLLLATPGGLAFLIYRESPDAVYLGVFLWLLGAILVLLSVLASRPVSDVEQWPQEAARWLLLALGVLLCVGVMVVVSWLPALLLLILLTVMILRCVSMGRHAVAQQVLSTIAAAVRQDLPLPQALASAAGGRTGKAADILRNLAEGIASGCPLGHAIRVGYRACPGHALAMIDAGERVGQLPAAMAALEADLADETARSRSPRPMNPVYLTAVFFYALLTVTGIMVFVLPKVRTILRQFDLEVPASTVVLVQFAEFYQFVLAPLIFLAVLIGVPMAIYVRFRPRRADRPRALSRVGDFLKWHLPILHWFERRCSLLRTAAALRLALRAGCTLDEAIAHAEAMDVNEQFRARLRRWHWRVEAGEDVAAAARACRLGQALAWAFDARHNPGGAPAALAVLETALRGAYNHWGAVARSVFWPVMVLAVAAAGGAIVYGVLSPFLTVMYPAMLELVP